MADEARSALLKAEASIAKLKQTHITEVSTLKLGYEKMLTDIRKFHEEDKSFLEGLLKKKEERARRGAAES